jgi:hypothetical protein
VAECVWEDGETVEDFKNASKDEVYEFLERQKFLRGKEGVDESDKGISESFWRFFRFDRAAVGRASKNPVVRHISKILFEDPVGESGVRVDTASSIKTLESGRIRTLYYKNYVPAFKKFLEERGLSKRHLLSHHARLDFNKAIASEIRGRSTGSQAAKAAADNQAMLYRDILETARSAGVKGIENVAENQHYISRVWSRRKMMEAVDELGEEQVTSFLARAMVSGDYAFKNAKKGVDELSDKHKIRLAKHLVKSVVKGTRGEGVNLERIFQGRAEEVKDYLNGIGYQTDEIDEMMSILFRTSEDAGRVKYLKRRININELYTDPITGRNIDDLLEQDAELLFVNYVNTMTGQIALASKGIKSRADWDYAMREVDKWYEDNPDYTTGFFGRTRKENQKLSLQSGYDYIVGKPLADQDGTLSTLGRIMRKYNFSRVMNQVGFAQLSEMGNLIAAIGIRQTIRAIPEIRNMMTRMKDGTIKDDLIDEAEAAFGGWGNERLINQITNQTEDFGSRLGGDSIGNTERILDQVNRFTTDISGMNAVNMVMKRMLIRGMLQKFADEAAGKGTALGTRKFSLAKTNQRYEDIGIDENLREAIMEQFRKHSKDVNGNFGGKIKKINIDKWDNPEVATKFSLAMSRFARRAVQENDIGEQAFLGGVYDTNIGKILFQFRGFVTTAYGKHLLHGIRMADFQTAQAFMMSSMFGALGYTLQTHAQAQFITDKRKRREFYDERFGKKEDETYRILGKAAFQRAAYASIVPSVIDTGAYLTGFDPIFNYRSTGLDTNLITGNPTYQLLFGQGLTGATRQSLKAMHDEDYDYSQQQWNKTIKLLTFQNVLGIQQGLRAFGAEVLDLPEKPQ